MNKKFKILLLILLLILLISAFFLATSKGIETKEKLIFGTSLGTLGIIALIYIFSLYKYGNEFKNYSSLLDTLLNANINGVFLKDKDLRYIFLNKSFLQMSNLKEEDILDKFDHQVYKQEKADLYRDSDAKVIKEGVSTFVEIESENMVKRTTKFPVKLLDGSTGVGGCIEDITEEYKNKEKLNKLNTTLNQERQMLRLILDSTAEGIFGLDNEGNCTFINDSALNLLGYKSNHDVIGRSVYDIIHIEDYDGKTKLGTDCKIFGTLMTRKKSVVDDINILRADGKSSPVEFSASPQFMGDECLGIVVTFNDITDRKKTQEEIVYLSYNDALTGLYNRRFFEVELKRLDVKRNLPLSIIIGDVNGLKLINDIFGHKYGDELIKKVAKAMKQGCREDDIISRWGGDEFAILLPNTNRAETEQIIQRIHEKISKENVEGLNISIALGGDTKVVLGEDINRIIMNAEENMYLEKTLKHKNTDINLVDSILIRLKETSLKGYEYAVRVSGLSEKMAKELEIPDDGVEFLKLAGLYQDIGKIIFDKDIIEEEKPLSPKEIEDLKRHAVMGYRILNFSPETSPIAKYVLHHHENWDGQGYPSGLKGEEIPVFSRIIAITGAYERLISQPPYGKGLEVEEAIGKIEEQSGVRFDPSLVEVFVKMIRKKKEAS